MSTELGQVRLIRYDRFALDELDDVQMDRIWTEVRPSTYMWIRTRDPLTREALLTVSELFGLDRMDVSSIME